MASLKPIDDVKQKENEKPMKYYQIVLDGIDKTGKDLIRSYIFYLGQGRYICIARGLASMRVYSKLYKRNYQYDEESQKYTVNVLLTVDKDDWTVRCKHVNESLTNYERETQMFNEAFEEMRKQGLKTLGYNTSHRTPYDIAKSILEYMEKLNGIE